ncbi:MAG: GAF domain-containing protein [Acidobacteriota bacterium]|nr:GAF domain-containing protein [Acidobacteriota bacterium]
MSDPSGIGGSEVSLESVLSTGELNARPPRPPDYETENRALAAIAQHMADSPETTLQKLAEVAMQICRAGSAGVSLLSEKDGNFYWPAVAGAWKPHLGGGTPRHFGPCGVVLDRDAVQLFTHPERYYPYLIPASPPIEEALLTPFYIGGEAVGTVWVVAHDIARKFDAEDMRLIESLGRLAAAAYPLAATLEAQQQQSQSMRDINEALMVSSVRQHQLTDQAQKAETALRESEERLSVELAATQQLQQTSTQLIREDNVEALYQQILDAAVAIMRSEFASIQMLYPERGPGGELGLLGYRGFSLQAARFWKWVRPASEGACGIALRTGQRVIIADVQTSDVMAGTEDQAVCLQTGIQSAQTTPLVSRTGKLLGMISTHWRQPHRPSEHDLRLLDVLARLAADLLERSQAEKALQNLNTDLRHFSFAASHDLQEPLRVVMNYTQLLARQYKGRLDPQADQFIAYAVDAAQRMEALLRDMREYWSVNEQKIENLGPTDCSRVLERALADLDFAIQASGAAVTHDPLPMVIAEEFPLTLLFQNLIGNAIKYRRPEAPPRIHLAAQHSDTGWRISVTDNGIGIEAKHLEAIFAPFKRLHGTEYPGTGLGLAMCQRVVERYRGQIWVESRYGQGSTFYFTLPA